MKKLFGILVLLSFMAQSQNTPVNPDLPYRSVPDYPKEYTAGTAAARVIDGLGFRFYWVTDSLTIENLAFRPGEDARSIEETIDHIYAITCVLRDAVFHKVSEKGFSIDPGQMSFRQKRKATLMNIKEASDVIRRSTPEQIATYKMLFRKKDGSLMKGVPFWNMLHGPIVDAIWHVGQVVSFRRSAGNPLIPSSNSNYFWGRPLKRE